MTIPVMEARALSYTNYPDEAELIVTMTTGHNYKILIKPAMIDALESGLAARRYEREVLEAVTISRT